MHRKLNNLDSIIHNHMCILHSSIQKFRIHQKLYIKLPARWEAGDATANDIMFEMTGMVGECICETGVEVVDLAADQILNNVNIMSKIKWLHYTIIIN